MGGAGATPLIYRRCVGAGDLVCERVKIEESDLLVCAPRVDRAKVEDLLMGVREELKAYIRRNPAFARSFVPVDVGEDAPLVVRLMASSAARAGVGPMAAVAGAIAQVVGEALGDEVIVENGGDVYIKSRRERVVTVYAGDSPFSMRVGIRLPPGVWGVATSSGTLGHSFSRGRADAAVVVARCSAVADAFATALGNRISRPEDMEAALDWVLSFGEVVGALAVVGDRLGACGDIELVRL